MEKGILVGRGAGCEGFGKAVSLGSKEPPAGILVLLCANGTAAELDAGAQKAGAGRGPG